MDISNTINAVKDAAANAASEMPWFDETRSYSIAGDGSVKLTLSKSGLGGTNQIDYETALNTISSGDYRLTVQAHHMMMQIYSL